MRSEIRKYRSGAIVLQVMLVVLPLLSQAVAAQNPEIQQRLAEIKENSAKNKENLATYTWQEQDTISLKGEVKKQEQFQVRLGPDGNAKDAAERQPSPGAAQAGSWWTPRWPTQGTCG